MCCFLQVIPYSLGCEAKCTPADQSLSERLLHQNAAHMLIARVPVFLSHKQGQETGCAWLNINLHCWLSCLQTYVMQHGRPRTFEANCALVCTIPTPAQGLLFHERCSCLWSKLHWGKLLNPAVCTVVLHRAVKVCDCLSINSAVRLLANSRDLNNIAGSRKALAMMLDGAPLMDIEGSLVQR